ncbi:Synaptobrevin [Cooperia oncophora]
MLKIYFVGSRTVCLQKDNLLYIAITLQVNVEKVLERDQKLSQLDDRADALQEGASQFEKSAATLKRKYWWKNIKMMIIMCAITVILIIIIVLWAGGK